VPEQEIEQLSLINICPNPTRGSISIRMAVPGTQMVEVGVYDVLGQLIWRNELKGSGGGIHSLDWDGRNSSGRPVSAGIYFVRISAGRIQQPRLCS